MRKRLRRVVLGILLTVLGGVAALGFSWWRVARCSVLAHDELTVLPHRKVGLVLGCSPQREDGSENWFFTMRMVAAAELFKAGKVDYLLVSGDNRRRSYDEPTWMRDALVARGIPAERIVCDYAGLTTLD